MLASIRVVQNKRSEGFMGVSLKFLAIFCLAFSAFSSESQRSPDSEITYTLNNEQENVLNQVMEMKLEKSEAQKYLERMSKVHLYSIK